VAAVPIAFLDVGSLDGAPGQGIDGGEQFRLVLRDREQVEALRGNVFRVVTEHRHQVRGLAGGGGGACFPGLHGGFRPARAGLGADGFEVLGHLAAHLVHIGPTTRR
jgi:hypothetical protein